MAAAEQTPLWLRTLITLVLGGFLIGAPLAMMVSLYLGGGDQFTNLIKAHAGAMFGVPWAGAAAFIVVLVLRPVFGEMEFKVLGFEFKGSSGPVVLWTLCFLAEVFGIWLLW